MAWMDNIKTWTGLSVEEFIRIIEDRHKWRNYVHGVTNYQLSDKGQRKNRTDRGHPFNFVMKLGRQRAEALGHNLVKTA